MQTTEIGTSAARFLVIAASLRRFGLSPREAQRQALDLVAGGDIDARLFLLNKIEEWNRE
jgi:hypothetical protein